MLALSRVFFCRLSLKTRTQKALSILYVFFAHVGVLFFLLLFLFRAGAGVVRRDGRIRGVGHAAKLESLFFSSSLKRDKCAVYYPALPFSVFEDFQKQSGYEYVVTVVGSTGLALRESNQGIAIDSTGRASRHVGDAHHGMRSVTDNYGKT